jgi:hypothetical protein
MQLRGAIAGCVGVGREETGERQSIKGNCLHVTSSDAASELNNKGKEKCGAL